ncbi:MAG: 4Fe-4S dicluster domain-containing protein [Deltaproteobacteria bacterium]|nr:4Fe-4S dicluster domain-containing protein [Deltaproteobacteria bacterium]
MKSDNVLLIFKSNIMYKPVIYRLARDFDLIFNILEAKILPRREGRILLELRGDQGQIDQGIKFLEEHEVVVERLADKVWREEDRCVHCGACTGLCPTHALSITSPNMRVAFDVTKCVACGMCGLACPFGAMRDITLFDPFAEGRTGQQYQ